MHYVRKLDIHPNLMYNQSFILYFVTLGPTKLNVLSLYKKVSNLILSFYCLFQKLIFDHLFYRQRYTNFKSLYLANAKLFLDENVILRKSADCVQLSNSRFCLTSQSSQNLKKICNGSIFGVYFGLYLYGKIRQCSRDGQAIKV